MESKLLLSNNVFSAGERQRMNVILQFHVSKKENVVLMLKRNFNQSLIGRNMASP